MSLSITLAAFVTFGALLYVARPFFAGVAPPAAASSDTVVKRRLELVEERDRALAALKELEFDHRTGKISDSDYRALVGPLRLRAAEALRSLEAGVRTESIAARPPARRADVAERDRRSAVG
jgi:hypothetical protein